MVDLVPLIAVAQQLISDNGRSVTFLEFDSTLQDPNRPWLGPADPRATPDSTLTIDAVFVEPSSATRLGLALETDDLIQNSEQIMIVSPGAQTDLSPFQEVTDGSTNWKITTTQTLRPGSQTALAFVGLRR